MTLFILGGMFAMWILVQGAGFDEYALVSSVCNLGMVPGEITHMAPLGSSIPVSRTLNCAIDNNTVNYFTPLISLFLHGGWAHILGNALFLWVFGNDIEDAMGPGRFLAFYLICGLAAAYLVLYPQVRIRMLFIFVIFFKVFAIPAWLVLIWWFTLQLLTGLPQVLTPSPEIAGSGGVAVWAHVGGFLAGVLLVRLFVKPERVARRQVALRSVGVPAG
jgi:membrane associated rhomboid family serine protease